MINTYSNARKWKRNENKEKVKATQKSGKLKREYDLGE